MADTIVEITFTGVELQGSGSLVGTFAGTLSVDYTTNTATLAPGTSSLTFSGDGFSYAFTSFSLSLSGTYHLASTSADGQTLTLGWTNQTPVRLSTGVVKDPTKGTFSRLNSSNHLTSVPCFVAGTQIRQPQGDASVESLKAGDVIVTASGRLRPVKWIGHRRIDCRRHPEPRAAWPIRIGADALGPGRPTHDLLISSGHAICVDLFGEVLIQAGNLINGATIVQVEVDEVDYWHVELENHDLVLANGVPAESYLEMANRHLFAGAQGTGAGAWPRKRRTYADFCRPVMTDASELEFVRRRLLARAEAIGWTRSCDPDLRLVADDALIRPHKIEDEQVFVLPPDASDIALVSSTFVPASLGTPDPRQLGVCLHGVAFVAGADRRKIDLNDSRLNGGLHPEEARDGASWRWTRGELRLKAELFAGMEGPIALHVRSDDGAVRGWAPPASAPPQRPVQAIVELRREA